MKHLFTFLFCAVLIVASGAFAEEATYEVARLNGATTTNMGVYLHNVDHTDSLSIDTFYSDILDVAQDKWINIGAQINDWTPCDSCEDSTSIIVRAYTAWEGTTSPVLLKTDTFGTDGTITDDEILVFKFRSDSLLFNTLYFMTILTDSIRMDADSTSADSTRLDIDFHVLHRPYEE